MSTFLQSVSYVCANILPLIGLIALVLVVILLIELIKALKNANIILSKGSKTVDLVDDSIKKVQAPLDTAVKVSHTIDVAHDATIKGLGQAKDYVSKNAKVVRKKLDSLSKTSIEDEAIKEPSPDDIIGGE